MRACASHLAAVTIVLAPRNVLAWGSVVTVWVVNWALLAVSPRGQMFGIFCLVALRYQFELLAVLFLFSAVIIHNVLRTRLPWTRVIRSPVGMTLLLCASVGYSGASAMAGTELASSRRYDDFRRVRSYMSRLIESVRAVRERSGVGTEAQPLRIARGWPPPYVLGKHQVRFGHWPKFMKVLGVHARYSRSPKFEVDATGRLVPRR